MNSPDTPMSLESADILRNIRRPPSAVRRPLAAALIPPRGPPKPRAAQSNSDPAGPHGTAGRSYLLGRPPSRPAGVVGPGRGPGRWPSPPPSAPPPHTPGPARPGAVRGAGVRSVAGSRPCESTRFRGLRDGPTSRNAPRAGSSRADGPQPGRPAPVVAEPPRSSPFQRTCSKNLT